MERLSRWWKKLGSETDAKADTKPRDSSKTARYLGPQEDQPPKKVSSSGPATAQPAGVHPPAPPPPAPAPQQPAEVVQPKPREEMAPEQPPAPQAPPKAPNPRQEIQEFFAEAGVHNEANRYTVREVIGRGSYGLVCSAIDNFTGERVAIKKITNVFEHVSDATRILREIKLLRLLKHPDIVQLKHIMLPPTPRDYKDIYVVFELMETDLHQVIKANDDLTPEHHQFFLYQMLRGLKYIHSAKVFHRDLKPKNILANSDCKLKICDFGLARPAFNDQPTTIFWTDYVATRWYRAPELCGSFFAKYSPAIDVWSVGCIFAEVLLGKPLFPGRNVVHQIELITDLLGTPSAEVVAKVRNEKARRFLASMPKKPGIPFEQYFPHADPAALRLLRKLLAFDPSERPSSEEALTDPYFTGLHSVAREPSAQPISKLLFEFDRRKLTIEDVRELIYREILEYHPRDLQEYISGNQRSNFTNPSALDNFKRQFMHLEANPGTVLEPGARPSAAQANGSSSAQPRIQQATSLPKEMVHQFRSEAAAVLASCSTAGPAAGSAPPSQTQPQPNQHTYAAQLLPQQLAQPPQQQQRHPHHGSGGGTGHSHLVPQPPGQPQPAHARVLGRAAGVVVPGPQPGHQPQQQMPNTRFLTSQISAPMARGCVRHGGDISDAASRAICAVDGEAAAAVPSTSATAAHPVASAAASGGGSTAAAHHVQHDAGGDNHTPAPAAAHSVAPVKQQQVPTPAQQEASTVAVAVQPQRSSRSGAEQLPQRQSSTLGRSESVH